MKYDETSVLKVLKSVFGYENFQNTVQKDAIAAIIEGAEYVCISMPPGSGRSLCFQLPAVLQKGKIIVVFSTKLSFMKKQIDFLRSKQIHACLLHQRIYSNKRNVILNDLMSTSPKTILLYATPNLAVITYFQNLILSLKQRKLLSYIVFNEAHCLSKLGYEYDPTYKKINQFNKIYGYIPRIAITTTVTDKVINDICKVLALKTPKIFKLAVQKVNVYCDIWFLDILSHPFEHLKNFIMEVLGFLDSAIHKIHKSFVIIYCKEAVTAELLKNKLNAFGISTLTYHYKLSHRMQQNIENKWISGDACVITTTYNYGFIYKKSIRCTIYWTVPENISKYYRELAQTHSDNNQTYCRIYFSTKEYSLVKGSIENHVVSNDTEYIKQRLSEYNKFVSYCLSVKCRHAIISNYFGCYIPLCKTNCDVCKNKEMVEIRTYKFIMFSEGIEGVKYNICDISGDLPTKETDINSDISSEKQLEDILKNDSKKSKVTCKETTAEDVDKWIMQYNAKLQLNKQKQLPAKSSFFVNEKLQLDKQKQLPAKSSFSVIEKLQLNNRKQLPTKRSLPINEKLQSDKQKQLSAESSFSVIEKLQLNNRKQLPTKSSFPINEKLQWDKQKQLPAESSSPISPRTSVTQTITASTVNCEEDNVDIIYVGTFESQPLANKNNLNKWITSQQPTTSRNSITKDTARRINSVKILSRQNGHVNESKVKVLNNISQTKVDERSLLNSSGMSSKPVVVNVKKCHKRLRVMDAGSENLMPKRRRLDAGTKATIEIEKMKDKRIVMDQCVKHAENNANVSGSRDKAVIECMINKYNLNRESITLEIRRK